MRKDFEFEKMVVGLIIVGLLATTLMSLLVRPFKRKFTREFDLEERSFRYKSWRYFLGPLRWVCSVIALVSIFYVATHVLSGPPFFGGSFLMVASRFLELATVSAVFLLTAFIFALITFLKEHAEDESLQKKLAGKHAENVVGKYLDKMAANNGGAAIHGALFCFCINTRAEYSIEVDHVYVTSSNVYLIETKYKSGTIVADRDSHSWAVVRNNKKTNMRNALHQVGNAARVLEKECGLVDVVPIVVIVGNDVRVESKVPNVVSLGDLPGLVDSYEILARGHRTMNPHELTQRLNQLRTNDPEVFKRHVARIRTRYA